MARTGGQLLIDCLEAQGVTTALGVPGESYLAVLDALHDSPIRFVLCRHEGGAAFMAEAWGKLDGRPGICFVTRGPGATNASIGVHTAKQNSSPMILFVGQVARGMRDREAFQEVDYRAFFGTVAKWAVEIDDPSRVPEIVSRAFHIAMSGRPGPVVVALPEDMLTELTDALPGPRTVPARAGVDPDALAQAGRMLAAAERPVIFAGGGGWTAEGRASLQRFAERWDLPVAASFRCQDLLDNHSPSYIGDAGTGMLASTKAMLRDADLVLAIGIGFSEIETDSYTLFDIPKPKQTLIHVHGSDLEIGKVCQPDLAIHAGADAFVRAAEGLEPNNKPWGDWRAGARAAFEASQDCPAQPGAVDMGVIAAHLRQVLPADAIVTNGAGNFTVWPNKFLLYGAEGRLVAPQAGAMGYGLPAGIASRLWAPERLVVSFVGDGEIQMTLAELGTAMQAGAMPILLILNNGTYGTIRMHQERDYPTRVSGTTLENPDFVAIGKAYGFHSERVSETGQFEGAFERTRAAGGGVIELMIDTEALTPRATLSQIRAAALAR
ncbi:MAG TPA: thiamine pyrophosphate-binding protein [Hyphomicrobiaceae bacterium]|nr:thiamine pyrophosphate-binding protein [Hyphomicrobiaceae bacterium]